MVAGPGTQPSFCSWIKAVETIFEVQEGCLSHLCNSSTNSASPVVWGKPAEATIGRGGIGPGDRRKQDGPLPHPSIHILNGRTSGLEMRTAGLALL